MTSKIQNRVGECDARLSGGEHCFADLTFFDLDLLRMFLVHVLLGLLRRGGVLGDKSAKMGVRIESQPQWTSRKVTIWITY